MTSSDKRGRSGCPLDGNEDGEIKADQSIIYTRRNQRVADEVLAKDDLNKSRMLLMMGEMGRGHFH